MQISKAEYQKAYRTAHREQHLAYLKEYRAKNRHITREASRRWESENKEKYLEIRRAYYRNRLATDVNFRLRHNLRARMRAAVRGLGVKSSISLIGCSMQDLRSYLESKFQIGMSWNNHGEWHIDHVKPLSAFDLTDATQLKAACHYTNLQPLWASDNLKKGASYGR